MISDFDMVENIVGKEENAPFSPFPILFSRGCFIRVGKSRLQWDCYTSGECCKGFK